MKILIINEVFGVLSTGRTVMELQSYLREQGHSCLVAYAYKKRSTKDMNLDLTKKSDYYMIGSTGGRKLHALFSRISGLQGYFSTGATKKLIRYISEQKPDIVHLGNVHGNYLNLNLLLLYLAKEKLPVVIVLHDCWFYTGRCTHYSENKCYQWHDGCRKCPNNKNTPITWFFDRSKKMWRDKKKYFTELNRLAVIGVSDWITDEARKSFLRDSYLIERIYNGINLEVFKPKEAIELRRELGLEDKFVILSVAAIWGEAKGLNGFLQLAEQLQKKHERMLREGKADKECIILLVGKNNAKLDIPSNVRFLPVTDNIERLSGLYNAADVYISLSREESFGKTLAEALACGTPAIAFYTTALPELIGEGCGHLVMNYSLKGVYESVLLVRDRGKEYYSDQCLHYAKAHFSKEDSGQKYCRVYEKLLS